MTFNSGVYTEETKGSLFAGESHEHPVAAAEGILQQTSRKYCGLPCQLRRMGLDHIRLLNCDRTGFFFKSFIHGSIVSIVGVSR